MTYKPHHKRGRSTHCSVCDLKLRRVVDGLAICDECEEKQEGLK